MAEEMQHAWSMNMINTCSIMNAIGLSNGTASSYPFSVVQYCCI